MRMHIRAILAASVALVTAGCNNETTTDGGTGGGSGGGTGGFQQPAGTVAVNFSVDDTANKVFTAHDGGASDLWWKGGFEMTNAATRTIVADAAWNGPHPALYDDGPWTSGGHEPSTATAGDHKWGVTVFVLPPAATAVTYEYGLKDGMFPGQDDGWLWRGSNGSFTVSPGATSEITAAGLTLLAFGTTDLKIELNTASLVSRPPLSDGGTPTWDTSAIYVKGGGWAWLNVQMYDDATHGDATSGDGIYTFTMSNAVGAGTSLPHSGLLSSGDKPQFVVSLGADKAEYRDAVGPSSAGVKAYFKATGGAFVETTISHDNTDKNNMVTVP